MELVWRLVVSLTTATAATLSQPRGNFIKGSALCLGHFEIGEDEKDDQQHCEDDKDVGTTELLRGKKGKCEERESDWRGFCVSAAFVLLVQTPGTPQHMGTQVSSQLNGPCLPICGLASGMCHCQSKTSFQF